MMVGCLFFPHHRDHNFWLWLNLAQRKKLCNSSTTTPNSFGLGKRNNMRILHGIDLVEVDRIKKLTEKYGNRFLKKFFSDDELRYAFGRKMPYIHLAGRFAAKEAGIKALSPICKSALSQFETTIEKNGSTLLIFKEKPTLKGIVSISHTKELAIASVIFVLNE